MSSSLNSQDPPSVQDLKDWISNAELGLKTGTRIDDVEIVSPGPVVPKIDLQLGNWQMTEVTFQPRPSRHPGNGLLLFKPPKRLPVAVGRWTRGNAFIQLPISMADRVNKGTIGEFQTITFRVECKAVGTTEIKPVMSVTLSHSGEGDKWEIGLAERSRSINLMFARRQGRNLHYQSDAQLCTSIQEQGLGLTWVEATKLHRNLLESVTALTLFAQVALQLEPFTHIVVNGSVLSHSLTPQPSPTLEDVTGWIYNARLGTMAHPGSMTIASDSPRLPKIDPYLGDWTMTSVSTSVFHKALLLFKNSGQAPAAVGEWADSAPIIDIGIQLPISKGRFALRHKFNRFRGGTFQIQYPPFSKTVGSTMWVTLSVSAEGHTAWNIVLQLDGMDRDPVPVAFQQGRDLFYQSADHFWHFLTRLTEFDAREAKKLHLHESLLESATALILFVQEALNLERLEHIVVVDSPFWRWFQTLGDAARREQAHNEQMEVIFGSS
ncbi:hypothetical protein C8R46DRAFT_1032983 [Mycena filopes]|nr:hypothetical protein C8R46DRAFT_1032983 [Mycena filopes]